MKSSVMEMNFQITWFQIYPRKDSLPIFLRARLYRAIIYHLLQPFGTIRGTIRPAIHELFDYLA